MGKVLTKDVTFNHSTPQKKFTVESFNGQSIILKCEDGEIYGGEIKKLSRLKNSRLAHNCAVFVKKYVQDYFGEDFSDAKYVELIPCLKEMLEAADGATIQPLMFGAK